MTDLTAPEPAPAAPGLSRRQALAVGGGLAAAAAVGSVAAPGTASAAEAVGPSETLRSVSAAQAKAVVVAAEREATRIKVPMNIVVLDVCGDVKGSLRQDGNARAALTLAPLKAQTALAFRTATADLARTPDPVRVQSFLAAGFTLLGGGLPIVVDGQVVGAVGVGGGSPEQDVQVAAAGLAALRS